MLMAKGFGVAKRWRVVFKPHRLRAAGLESSAQRRPTHTPVTAAASALMGEAERLPT